MFYANKTWDGLKRDRASIFRCVNMLCHNGIYINPNIFWDVHKSYFWPWSVDSYSCPLLYSKQYIIVFRKKKMLLKLKFQGKEKLLFYWLDNRIGAKN